MALAVLAVIPRLRALAELAAPGWSKAVESAALEVAGSSTRGSGWARSGPASPGSAETAQSRQMRPEEAPEPSLGGAQTAVCPCCRTSRTGSRLAASSCKTFASPSQAWRQASRPLRACSTPAGRPRAEIFAWRGVCGCRRRAGRGAKKRTCDGLYLGISLPADQRVQPNHLIVSYRAVPPLYCFSSLNACIMVTHTHIPGSCGCRTYVALGDG